MTQMSHVFNLPLLPSGGKHVIDEKGYDGGIGSFNTQDQRDAAVEAINNYDSVREELENLQNSTNGG